MRFHPGQEEVMDSKTFEFSLDKNPIISIRVTPGHFSTSFCHTNYYLDVSTMKAKAVVARDIAREFAIPYISTTIVDTIVCMENTKVIGAFLAQELLSEGTAVMNSGGDISVVTPMSSVDGKLLFYDNEMEWIKNKHILLLAASISSGRTLNGALECISYYGGLIAGISALFQYTGTMPHMKINSLFTSDDIPGYKVYNTGECDLCRAGQKLDALISSEGFRRI